VLSEGDPHLDDLHAKWVGAAAAIGPDDGSVVGRGNHDPLVRVHDDVVVAVEPLGTDHVDEPGDGLVVGQFAFIHPGFELDGIFRHHLDDGLHLVGAVRQHLLPRHEQRSGADHEQREHSERNTRPQLGTDTAVVDPRPHGKTHTIARRRMHRND
jgi:hypothetical protein